MIDLAQRVEAALAAASATILSAHAQLSQAAAARLASRLPVARTIALYCRAHDLSLLDASWIRMQALAHIGTLSLAPLKRVPAGAVRMERIRCAIREWVRVRFAPYGDPALQELLELEYAYSSAVILKLHVRNAVRFAAAVRPDFSGPAAVALYLDRMRVPDETRGAVYVMAVAHFAAVRFAAMLPAGQQRADAGQRRRDHAVERVAPALADRRATIITPGITESPMTPSLLGTPAGAASSTGDGSAASRS